MIKTDLNEYNFPAETKIPLVHGFPCILKQKARGIMTTGQCMIFQTFINLEIRPVLKVYFLVFPLTKETGTAELNPLYLPVSLKLS